MVAKIDPRTIQPDMTVGYAGDIPNAIEEKDSLVSDAAWATGFAFVLILGGIVFFFRSALVVAVIALPAFIGVGCAYSFAMVTYGYVNTTGTFLGAIILGNGINYPIVLLSRYREFRARGQAPTGPSRRGVERVPRGARRRVRREHRLRVARHYALPRLQPVRDDRLRRDAPRLGLDDSVRPGAHRRLRATPGVAPFAGCATRRRRSRSDGSLGPVTRMIAIATERAPWAFWQPRRR